MRRMLFLDRTAVGIAAALLLCGGSHARAAGPVPGGSCLSTVSYETTSGPVSFSAEADYAGSTPGDAVALGDAPNIVTFNSVNTYGRRLLVDGAIGPDESLVAHAFFKINNSQAFFPDGLADAVVTMTIENIEFSQPVEVIPETILLHVRWVPDQVDLLPQPYVNLTNHYTTTQDFRDFKQFHHAGVFSKFPVPNFVLAGITARITYNNAQSFNIEVAMPYDLLRNLEEQGQKTPPSLPAPHGFLEPFHWHLEYLVHPSSALAIIESLPADMSIDARQPSDILGGPGQGPGEVELMFSGSAADLTVDSFLIEQAGGAEPPPSIFEVEHPADDRVRIILSEPMHPGSRLSIGLADSSVRVCLGYLPGDANANGHTAPNDLLALIDGLNGVADPPLTEQQCDINRTGQCEPLDILRLVDLLNGAGAFDSWNGVTLPECP